MDTPTTEEGRPALAAALLAAAHATYAGTDVPASYRLRRTVPPYKPARTPYVGKQIARQAVVIIREAWGTCATKAGEYWVAPILEDGTFGAMSVAHVSATDLIDRRDHPS